MVENVTQIKSGITTNFDVSVKIQKNMFLKNIVFGIQLHKLVQIVNF